VCYKEQIYNRNSHAEWLVQMPFWSLSTLRRVLLSLRAQGLIRTANYNARPKDRTLWYTVDYAAVAALGVPLGPAATGSPPAENSTRPVETSSPPVETGSPPAENSSRPVENDTRSVQNGRSSAENDTRSVQNGRSSAETNTRSVQNGRSSAETSRPGAENGRPCAGFEPALPETTSATTSKSNTETPESVCAPAPAAIDLFTVTTPLLSGWASEREAAGIGPESIPLNRETDAGLLAPRRDAG